MDAVQISAMGIQALIGKSFDSYSITKNWLHLKSEGDIIFSVRRFECAKVPDFDKLLEIKDGEEMILPDISQALSRVSVMSGTNSKDDLKFVQVSITSDNINLKSEWRNKGWAEEDIPGEFEHEVSFKINPDYLRTILEKTSKLIITRRYCFFTQDDFVQAIGKIE
jgi:DNA polymerase III sliding clamp (beta) subunit (PCNA family)